MRLFSILVSIFLLMGCQGGGNSVVDNLVQPFSDIGGGATQADSPRASSAEAVNEASVEAPAHPVFSGLKKIVAVSRFENRSSFASQGAAQFGTGMRDMLADALMQSGRFIVLERQNLGDVMGEQDLAASGRVAKSQSARAKKLMAAQYIVQGVITEFQSNSDSGSSGISIAGFSFGGGSGSTHIGGIVRMIDTTTGEVIASERVEGAAKGSSSGVGVNFGEIGFKTKSKKADPLDKAVQALIDKAVQAIVVQLGERPYRGRIIQVKGGSVVVTASERNGAKPGDEFTVYSVGKEMVDPYTGEILGREEKEVGRVRITKVKEKYSFCKCLGRFRLKAGDFIQSNS